jgi:hypothetical protein
MTNLFLSVSDLRVNGEKSGEVSTVTDPSAALIA